MLTIEFVNTAMKLGDRVVPPIGSVIQINWFNGVTERGIVSLVFSNFPDVPYIYLQRYPQVLDDDFFGTHSIVVNLSF